MALVTPQRQRGESQTFPPDSGLSDRGHGSSLESIAPLVGQFAPELTRTRSYVPLEGAFKRTVVAESNVERNIGQWLVFLGYKIHGHLDPNRHCPVFKAYPDLVSKEFTKVLCFKTGNCRSIG
jgi:hypothetical protein